VSISSIYTAIMLICSSIANPCLLVENNRLKKKLSAPSPMRTPPKGLGMLLALDFLLAGMPSAIALTGQLPGAVPLYANNITVEAILIAVPNHEALALAAKSEPAGVSGTSLAQMQELVAENKARSAGVLSATSPPGNPASSSQGGIKLEFSLAARDNEISGPLILRHGEAEIATTINARNGDVVYLGSFIETGETYLVYLRLNLSGAPSIAVASASDPAAGFLGVGDPAPAIQAGAWIQGEPVTGFAPDKVYLIEFWATWCGPCVQSIPHLNEIAAAYDGKGLVVIGQNISEPDESRVKPFVEKMGDKMTYRVALDDKSRMEKGAMATMWLKASGATGIPVAFLVGKDGKIAWIGHPMELQGPVIEQVLAGTFDLEQEAVSSRRTDEALKLGKEIEGHYHAGRWDEAEAALNKASELFPEEPQDIALLRARIAVQRMATQLDQHIKAKAWNAADATVEKLSELSFEEALPGEAKKEIETMALKARLMILLGRGDWDAAATKTKQLPRAEAIDVVQEAIAMSDDEATFQRLRHMMEHLRADMRPEHVQVQ